MFKALYRFFKKTIGKKLLFTVAGLAALCELVKSLTLALPFLVEKFITQIQQGTFSLFLPKIILISYTAIFIMQSVIVWFFAKRQMDAKVELQVKIFDSLLVTNPGELKKRGEGFYTSLMESSVDTLMNFLTPFSFSAFFNASQIFIILGILYYKSITIGIACTILLVLYFTAFLLNNKLFSSILSEYIEKNSTSVAKIYDFIKGNKVLISNAEYRNFAHNKVLDILKKVQAIELKLQYFFELIFSTLQNFIQPCMNLLIIVILGKDVINSSITFGSFVLVLTYYNLLQGKFESFQRITDLMFHTTGALKSLEDFISEDNFITPKAINPDGSYFLKFKDVSLFADEKVLLDGINLTVQDGSNYAVIGSSGTGKSSFINLILGFTKPDAGEVTLKNESQECSKVFALQDFAFLSQSQEIFNLTLQDNIFLSENYDEKEFNELVQKFEMKDLQNRNLGSDSNAISGGEKQKVLLARFIHQLKDKKYYILDEPFTGMDIVTKKKLLLSLKPYLQDKTGLCITHDQIVLDELCNKVLLLTKNHGIVQKPLANLEDLLLEKN